MNKIFTIKKEYAFLLLFALGTQTLGAQTRFFRPFSPKEKNEKLKRIQIRSIMNFSLLEIDEKPLKHYLSTAPSDKNSNKMPTGILIGIPMPDGKVEQFTVYESSVLSTEQQLLHPEIKTYKGQGTLHSGYRITFTLTPIGFSAIITGVNGDVVMIEKIKGTPDTIYRSYFSKDAVLPESAHSGDRCRTISDGIKQRTSIPGITAAKFTNGSQKKVFRIAIAATGEFTTREGGQTNAFSKIVQYVAEMNAIYETEMGIRLNLVSGNNLVYTDPDTDPYTNNNQGNMLNENRTNLNNELGNNGYDIGHVFGTAEGSGGGVAFFQSVCSPTHKGGGVSGIGPETDYAHVFSTQLVAHEIGHQFGMSHSYNSNIPVCTTRAHITSVEPGSGATIMSYGFTCSNNNPSEGVTGNDDYHNNQSGGFYVGPFLNFHIKSIEQSLNYLADVNCNTVLPTGNALPVIGAMPASYRIPKSTPFYLKGTATDADNDILSYSWEGTNISDLQDDMITDPDDPNSTIPVPPSTLDGTVLDNTTHPPFFRSYPPINTGSEPGLRYYPLLSAILDGSNKAKGDKLPSIAYITTHTLSVRDGNGGLATENVTVNVENSGPFLITNDPSGTHNGGSSMVVTWSVNSTDNAPINCKLVDIWLSTDGGYTFTSQLAAAVPNNGSASVVLPNIATNKARIKVMPSTSTASGNVPNIFFDISNNDFTIIGSTLGTQEVNNADIQIYRTDSDIIINSDIRTIYAVELYDRAARSLYKKSNINSHKVAIPSARYSKHILVVKVITDQGKIVTKKIIID